MGEFFDGIIEGLQQAWEFEHDEFDLPTSVREVDLTAVPDACRECSNHPNNGGSGLCSCTLGEYLYK